MLIAIYFYDSTYFSYFSSEIITFGVNFYEMLLNFFNTDLYGLFLVFYQINSFEFLILIFLILVITLILVKLYNMTLYFHHYSLHDAYIKRYRFAVIPYFFKRTQPLAKQFYAKPTIKGFFRKKKFF